MQPESAPVPTNFKQVLAPQVFLKVHCNDTVNFFKIILVSAPRSDVENNPVLSKTPSRRSSWYRHRHHLNLHLHPSINSVVYGSTNTWP